MPRKDQGWITFQTSEDERQLLEEICQVTQRTKTEVLREMLRGLKSAAPVQASTPTRSVEAASDLSSSSTSSNMASQNVANFFAGSGMTPPKKPLKVSSRNVLKGRIKRLIPGSVNTEVTLEIVHVVELTSTITTTSAQELGLAEGEEAYAVIKSSDVVIAME